MPKYVPIIITADGRQAEAAFDRLEKKAARVRSALRGSSTGMSLADVRQHEAVAREMMKTAKLAEQLSREQIRTAREVQRVEIDANREQSRVARETATEQRRQAREVLREQERAARESARAVERAERDKREQYERTARAGRSLSDAGSSVRNAGLGLSAAVTAPIVLAGREILRAGVEYESAMNVFQATTRATSEEMERTRATAKALGADIELPATSAADAAASMTELAKAGFTATQAMEGARGVLQLAAAAQIEEAQAAEIAANALNSFNLRASESTRIADLLAAAANASSAEITDVAQSMAQASAVFGSARVPIEDLVTLIGLMANAGIKGSDAGTSLRTMLMRLQAPTKDAGAMIQRLGVYLFDAQGKLIPFREIVGQFSGSLSKLTDQQRAQALETVFGADAMRAAAVVFGKGAESYDQMREAVTRQGAAAELAAAKTKGLGGAWEAFKSQLETIAITIFERVSPSLEMLARLAATFAGKIGDAFEGLSPVAQKAIFIFTGIAAAVGPALFVLGSLGIAVGAIATGFATVLSVGATVVGFLGGLGPAFVVIAGVVAGAAVQLAALGTAAYALYEAWQNNFLGIRDLTYEALGAVRQFVEEQGARIVGWWRENLPLIQQTVRTTLANVQTFWAENGEAIVATVRGAWGVIKAVVTTALDVILGVMKTAMQLINGDFAGAWETFVKATSGAWSRVLAAAVNFEANFLAWLGKLASFVSNKALEIGANIVTGVIRGLWSKKDELANAAAQVIAYTPLAIVNRALDRRSPSRVYMAVGRDIAIGLAIGIAQGAPAVAQELQRLVIPDKPELAAGAGSRAVNRQRRAADAANRPGYELLRRLYEEADRQTAKTRLQRAELELLGKEYKNLAANIREAIVAEAARQDTVEIQDRFKAILEKQNVELRGQESNLQEINRLLSDPAVLKAVGQRTAFILRMNAATLDFRKFDPLAGAAALPSGIEEFFKAQADAVGMAANRIPFINTIDPPPPVEQTQAAKAAEAFREYMGRTVEDIGHIFGEAASNWDGTFSGLFRSIGSGFNNLWRRIVGDFVQSGVTNLFRNLFGSVANGATSGGGGFVSRILGGLFGRGAAGPGGTPNFNPAAGAILPGGGGASSVFREFSALGVGRGITPPQSFAEQQRSRQSLQEVARAATAGRGGLLGSLFGGGGFSLSRLGAAAAPMLPLLSLSLGAGLGGQSRLGSILGGAGGLLLGGAGMAGLLGAGGMASIFGGSVTAPVFGSVGTGLGPALAGLLTNPFTIAAAGALLVGAAILARNARERRDERTRNAVSHDTGTAIWDLIREAQRGRLGLSEATSRFTEIKQRYFAGIQGLQGRARRHAEATWSHFQALWPLLEANAREADQLREQSKRFRETYSVPVADFAGLASGLSIGAASPGIGAPASIASPSPASPAARVSLPVTGGGASATSSGGGASAATSPAVGQSAPGQIAAEFYMDAAGMVDMLVKVPGLGEFVGKTAVKAVGKDALMNPSGNPRIFKESLRKQGVE